MRFSYSILAQAYNEKMAIMLIHAAIQSISIFSLSQERLTGTARRAKSWKSSTQRDCRHSANNGAFSQPFGLLCE